MRHVLKLYGIEWTKGGVSDTVQILLIALISSAVFVNGWTDAPNAITGIVATKSAGYRFAVALAAVCNLLGLLTMSLLNGKVANTITGIADFGGGSQSAALASLLAAMAAIVIFASAAWKFGIPTSESHALIAALTGAAISSGSFESVNLDAWKKVLIGLAASMLLGFFSGKILNISLDAPLKRLPPRTLDKFQIAAASGMAFMHGAQDGQKFVAVFVIAELLAKNKYTHGNVVLRDHMLVLILCALVMAIGTSVGGKRIIETVGTKMVRLNKSQSVCADLGSGICLLLASLTGVPMSTTHTKTTAIMGAAGKKNNADLKIAGEMFLAWAFTFPVCGLLGFFLAKLFAGFTA